MYSKTSLVEPLGYYFQFDRGATQPVDQQHAHRTACKSECHILYHRSGSNGPKDIQQRGIGLRIEIVVVTGRA